MCEGSGQLLWDWPRCGALLPAENEVKENRMRKGALPLAELQQNAQSREEIKRLSSKEHMLLLSLKT